jgi:hypothetical protein
MGHVRGFLMRFTWFQPIYLLWAVLGLSSLAGCASYEPNEHAVSGTEPDWATEGVVVESDAVKVRLVPLWHEDTAMQYLGIVPAKVGMLPVALTVENRLREPIKLDLADTYLKTTSGERWFIVPVSEATSRALAADAKTVDTLVLAVGLAYLPASSAYGRKAHSLEEDYHIKSFKPTLINGGAAGGGVLFFEFPEGTEAVPNLFYLPFSAGAGTGEISVDLPASLFE